MRWHSVSSAGASGWIGTLPSVPSFGRVSPCIPQVAREFTRLSVAYRLAVDAAERTNTPGVPGQKRLNNNALFTS